MAPLVVASILGAAGCSKRSNTAPPGSADAPAAPVTRNTPECAAVSAYQLTQLAGALPPEKIKEGVKMADTAAANLKKAVPELAADVDAQMAVLRKLADGEPLGSVDADNGKKIQTYWEANCVVR